MLTLSQWAVLHEAQKNAGVVQAWENSSTLAALMNRFLVEDTNQGLIITPLGVNMLNNQLLMTAAPSFYAAKQVIYGLR